MYPMLRVKLTGLPPTVNHLYRNGDGRRYKTAAGREYQAYVTEELIESWGGKGAYEGQVELRIRFETADRRRWDIDNRVKALQDCLSMAGILRDDSQIEVLHVERTKGTKTATHMELREHAV